MFRNKHVTRPILDYSNIKILMVIVFMIISMVTFRAHGQTSYHVPIITKNDDGLYSIEAHGSTLQSVTDALRDRTNIQIFVNKEVRNVTITINKQNLTLIELIKEIAGDNYAVAFEDYEITSLYILNAGLEHSQFLDSGFSEFSGKIQVSQNRARMFFITDSKNEQGINNYILKRHYYLEYLKQQDPNLEIQVQISFENYLSASELLEFVEHNNIHALGLSIGSGEHGGGYELREGESLESALTKAEKHHGEFVATLLEDAESGLSDQDFAGSAKKLSDSYRQSGVKYYGIRGAGTVANITGTLSTDIVRLADPLVGGTVEEELMQAYSVTKIGIPLQPIDE